MARFFAMLLPERSNFGLNELLDLMPDCHVVALTELRVI